LGCGKQGHVLVLPTVESAVLLTSSCCCLLISMHIMNRVRTRGWFFVLGLVRYILRNSSIDEASGQRRDCMVDLWGATWTGICSFVDDDA
jgi:hypothetical protein